MNLNYIPLLLAVFLFFTFNLKAQEFCSENSSDHPRRVAVIGDYGHDGEDNGNAAVSKLVKSIDPNFIITLGDNIYPAAKTMKAVDNVVGRYYSKYLSQGNFYPSIGNHDVENGKLPTYLSYFKPPGNGRYYDFVCGPVHFFSLNSDSLEQDGTSSHSQQAKWLKKKLEASTAKFKVVYFHHPPYSSGYHGPSEHMQWPFKKWGVDVVMSGHEHNYERINRDGVSYVVNGLGGTPYIRGFKKEARGSVVRYNDQFGALFLTIGQESLKFKFVTIDGRTVDAFEVKS